MPADELRARVADADALVCVLTDAVDTAHLDAAPRLKIVANVAVGYNNIDVAHARARGVVVTNTPDVLTESVADFTWAMILAITGRLAKGERLFRRGAWKGGRSIYAGPELTGANSSAWSAWGRRGRRMHVARHDTPGPTRAQRSADIARRATAARRRSASAVVGPQREEVGPTQLKSRSLRSHSADQHVPDVVSLHVPLTADTRHLIDKKALTRMKRSAYLVNTSRGPVVDEEALAWALQQHLLAGAALDVYENEPVVHPDLLALENVVLVPAPGQRDQRRGPRWPTWPWKTSSRC